MQIKIHKDDIHMEDDYLVINLQDDEFKKQLQELKDIILQMRFDQRTQSRRAEDTEELLNKHDSMIAVLGMGSHSHKLSQLKSTCKKRVWKLLGNPSSASYVLLAGYFYSKIYVDIAKYFGVDKCGNIPVKEFDMAMEQACRWCPSDHYVFQTITELKKKWENGLLSQEKCEALSTYLLFYNENDNPFKCR